jgi:hypothetical protein
VCGRYSLTGPNPAQVRARFGLEESVEVRRRFNVAPGDDVVCVTTTRDGAPRGELLRWGLVPHWAKDPATGFKMINARAETVADKPAYRDAFARRRCLVVADGFYEWRREAAGRKAAHWITRSDGSRSPSRPVGDRGGATRTTRWRCARAPSSRPGQRPGGRAARPDAGDPPARGRGRVAGSRDARARPAGAAAPVPGAGDGGAGGRPAVNDARYDGPACLDPPPEPAEQTLF